MSRAVLVLAWIGVASMVAAADAPPGGALHWRSTKAVDAAIDAWPLDRVVGTIAQATGWETYVEPGTGDAVTAHFEGLDAAAALRRLLGGMNFAVLPQVSGPPKLFVYRHSLADATRFVAAGKTVPPGKAAGRPLAGELVVRSKRGRLDDVERAAERLGGRVVGRLASLDALRLAFDDPAHAEDARRALADDDATDSVEPNVAIPRPEDPVPVLGESAAPFALRRDFSPSSDEVIVALIDTAVQTAGSPMASFFRDGISMFDGYTPPADQVTHGTAMAATILDSVARAFAARGDAGAGVPLSILPVDVYGPNEMTNTFDLGQGLYDALGQHVNVVNLSLGSDTDSPLLRSLIRDGAARGVLFFGAAGNEPVTQQFFPAADPGVISVTAGDHDGIAPYANRGNWVDTMAPGINVFRYLDQTWYGTGTSFATSWVSGWAAGYMANSGKGAAAVKRATLAQWAMPTKTTR